MVQPIPPEPEALPHFFALGLGDKSPINPNNKKAAFFTRLIRKNRILELI